MLKGCKYSSATFLFLHIQKARINAVRSHFSWSSKRCTQKTYICHKTTKFHNIISIYNAYKKLYVLKLKINDYFFLFFKFKINNTTIKPTHTDIPTMYKGSVSVFFSIKIVLQIKNKHVKIPKVTKDNKIANTFFFITLNYKLLLIYNKPKDNIKINSS